MILSRSPRAVTPFCFAWNKNPFVWRGWWVVVWLLGAGLGWGAAPTRPNVVFILADDLGWSDTTLNGTTTFYETPQLDKLARRSVRFANAYSANPLCSPTRASIMTGLYPSRIGIIQACCHVPQEQLEARLQERGPANAKSLMVLSATRLRTEYRTLAEVFHDGGYRTAHFGKWHLGPEPFDPLHQGYDIDIPHTPTAAGPGGGYLAPWKFIKDPAHQGKPGEHLEDYMARQAVEFIRESKAAGKPFFLSYWAFSVHAPISAKPELVEHFKAKARPDAAQRHPVYGAMVKSLDDAVGTLMAALDEAGLADNTIVVFTSDNGGLAEAVRSTSPAGYESIPVTSNAPLRAGKATIYEGGTRVPLLVAWPGKVKAGSTSQALVSSVDYYPTLLEMCGLKADAGAECDGVSQVPALLGRGAPRDTVFCHFPFFVSHLNTVPSAYVRQGDWKLIRFFADNLDQTDRCELYQLSSDPGEAHDVAREHPKEVAALNQRLDELLRDTKSLVPVKNPAYDPSAPPPSGKKGKGGKQKSEIEKAESRNGES